MNSSIGDAHEVASMLRERGWPVRGVFVGGCVSRGEGSSFRALAHTHTDEDDAWRGWICVRSRKRVLTDSGEPTRILRHEVAHVLEPTASHGSPRFIAGLARVGIRTDSYSRAGRRRRDGHSWTGVTEMKPIRSVQQEGDPDNGQDTSTQSR